MASNEELERRIAALEDEVRQLRRQLGSAPPIEPGALTSEDIEGMDLDTYRRRYGPANPLRPWDVRPPFIHTVVY